jgi:DHA3 family macrolide efflux protein-like MFS transporter
MSVIGAIVSWWSSLRYIVSATPASAGDDANRQQLAPYGGRIMGVLLFGQAISLIGSGLTAFALGIRIFQDTGSVTRMGAVILSSSLPGIVILPVAGAIVDRYDRRWVLIISNLGAGFCTLGLALPLLFGRLAMWEVYLSMVLVSSFAAVQSPAYAAVTPLLVSKQNLGRVNGVSQFFAASVQIVTPLLGAVLIARFKVGQIILIDFATFLVAVITLIAVRVPAVTAASSRLAGRSWWSDITFGWSYLAARPGLLILLLFGAFANFVITVGQVLIVPVVLGLSSPSILGVVQALGAAGAVLGSLLLVAWGVKQKQIRTMLRLGLVFGLAVICMGLRPSVLLIASATAIAWFCVPIMSGCMQIIWQTRTLAEVQGRIFAIRLTIGRSTVPLAPLVAGALTDRIFRPLLVSGGPLSGTLGAVIGVGSNRGAALLLVLTGIVACLAFVCAQHSPQLLALDESESKPASATGDRSCAQAVPSSPVA